MANAFKVITVAGTTTQATVYTVGSSTTTVVLGVMLGNTTTSQVTATVTLSSNTSSRPPSGTNSGNNADVELVTNAPIPAGSSLELLSGNKIVMETTDSLKLTASGATDIAVSIMEIT